MDSKILKRNTSVYTTDGKQKYTVDSLINSGTGQGDIYKVHSEKGTFALKLFHSNDTKRLLSQFELLIKRGRICQSYVYPLDIVSYEERVGYVMEYVGKEYSDAAVLYNGINVNGRRTELPFSQKLTLLYNITDAIRMLNEADLGLMDIKFDNIKVNPADGTVRILDTDTIVYTNSEAIVNGTIGFMPPLTMRGEEKPSKYNDYYAIAVMIFMTLIGSHPLVGRLSEKPCNVNIEQYTFASNPLYIFSKDDASNRPVSANEKGENQQRTINRMKKYPAYFRDAMEQTFVAGLYDGEKRVSPREWLDIIERLHGDSFICSNCGEEQFFGGINKKCDVCGKDIIQPVRIVCGKRAIPLFNGDRLYSSALFGDSADYEVFRVTVSDYDKKFGLYCSCSEEITYVLGSGLTKTFTRGDVIPIFLDGTLTVGKNTVTFSAV